MDVVVKALGHPTVGTLVTSCWNPLIPWLTKIAVLSEASRHRGPKQLGLRNRRRCPLRGNTATPNGIGRVGFICTQRTSEMWETDRGVIYGQALRLIDVRRPARGAGSIP
jgi:hypothetical protein